MLRRRDELDRLCDDFALAGMFSPLMFRYTFPPDPFLRWVADLGLREGRWLRERAAGAAA